MSDYPASNNNGFPIEPDEPEEFITFCYCCVCEKETAHREVDDDVFFENALECLVCHTVWEAE